MEGKVGVEMGGEIIKVDERVERRRMYVREEEREGVRMGRRTVVMKEGKIEEMGRRKEVYEDREKVFVGGFMGCGGMKFLKGKVREGGIEMG